MRLNTGKELWKTLWYTHHPPKNKSLGHSWSLYCILFSRYLSVCYLILPSYLLRQWCLPLLNQELEIWGISSAVPRETTPDTQSTNLEPRAYFAGTQLLSSLQNICLDKYSKGKNSQMRQLASHQFNMKQPVDPVVGLNYSLLTWLFCHLVHWLKMKNVFHKIVVEFCPWHVLLSLVVVWFSFLNL